VFLLKHGENNHLWFLFALVSIYLLLPAIKAIYDHDRNVMLWTLFLLFIFSFGNLAVNWCLNLGQAALGHSIDVVDGRIKRYQPFDIQGINLFSGYAWVLVYFIVGVCWRDPCRSLSQSPCGIVRCLFIGRICIVRLRVVASEYLKPKMFDTAFDGYSSIPGLAMTLSAFMIMQRVCKQNGLSRR